MPTWVFLIVGSGASTSIEAEALLPVPALDSRWVVIFTLCPPFLPTTLTVNVQEPPAATVPPERSTREKPNAVPVKILPAPHEPVSPLGLARRMPSGNISAKRTPVSATVGLGLVMVKVSVVVPFRLMLGAPNAFVMPGAPTTVMLAVLLVPPGPLSFDEIGPVVFNCNPAATPTTFRLMLHDAFPASVPPVRVMEDEPATAVVVPPQVLASAFGVATLSPAGSGSVNDRPVRGVAFGLLMLNVKLVVPFTKMVAAPNALVMVGLGVPTAKLALAVLPVPPFVEVTLPVVLVK